MKRRYRNKLFSAWDLLWVRCDLFFSTFRSRLSLRVQGCQAGKGFRTSGPCYFKARRAGSIRIGKNVTLLAGHRSNRVGLTNPVLLETVGDGQIEIGDHSGASAVVISSRAGITIGKNVKIGGNVRIFDHDYHSLDDAVRRTSEDVHRVKSKSVVIGDDVFIGTNAIILKGVILGARSIVAAGSVVVSNVPSDEIWGGNPARLLSRIDG